MKRFIVTTFAAVFVTVATVASVQAQGNQQEYCQTREQCNRIIRGLMDQRSAGQVPNASAQMGGGGRYPDTQYGGRAPAAHYEQGSVAYSGPRPATSYGSAPAYPDQGYDQSQEPGGQQQRRPANHFTFEGEDWELVGVNGKRGVYVPVNEDFTRDNMLPGSARACPTRRVWFETNAASRKLTQKSFRQGGAPQTRGDMAWHIRCDWSN